MRTKSRGFQESWQKNINPLFAVVGLPQAPKGFGGKGTHGVLQSGRHSSWRGSSQVLKTHSLDFMVERQRERGRARHILTRNKSNTGSVRAPNRHLFCFLFCCSLPGNLKGKRILETGLGPFAGCDRQGMTRFGTAPGSHLH